MQNFAAMAKENELLVAALYYECEKLFPAQADAFRALALEEEGHAEIIDRIILDLQDNPQHWQIKKISLTTLQLMHQRLIDTLKEVREQKYSPRYVLNALRSFEQSLCERSIETILVTSVPEFKLLLGEITAGFISHQQRLEQLDREIFGSHDIFATI